MMLNRVGLLVTLLCCSVPGLAHSVRHVSMDEHSFYASGFNVEKLVNQGNTQEAERQILKQLELSQSEQNERAAATGSHAMGHISLIKNNYPLALRQFQSSLDFFKAAREPLGMAGLYTDIGRTYRMMGLYQSALGYFNLAKDIYHQQGRYDGIALQQLEVGISLRQLGQFESALSQLERALPLLRQENNNQATASTLMQIARVYSEIAQNDEAMLYLQEAAVLIDTLQIKTLQAELDYHLGQVNIQMGHYANARRHLEQSRAQFTQLEAQCDVTKIDASLGNILIYQNQSEAGITLLESKLQQATLYNCTTLLTDLHLTLAQAYLGNDQKALKRHLEQGLQQAIERGELLTQARFEAVKMQMHEQSGDYQSALGALKRQQQLEKQSLEQRRSLALLYLQSQLDVERQAQSLELLNKNQAIQLAKAEQQELEVRMLYASLFAVTLLVFLIWSRFNHGQRSRFLKREVRRRTQELESKNAELENAYIALERASLMDPLTGLYNRQYLNNQLPQEINRAQQAYLLSHETHLENSPSDMLCFLLDIDNFKRINDTYGHMAGDRILTDLAKVMRSVFRPSDMLIRWGGEEFLAVCRNTNRLEAVALADRLRNGIHEHDFQISTQHSLHITCSIGFCVLPLYPSEPALLDWDSYFGLLDECLYAAKRSGKDCWIGLVGGKSASGERNATQLEEKFELPPTRIQTSLNHLSSINWAEQSSQS
ncbi:diguanylate cyclase [uncultured Alteromonas sp.]|uniref:tetratricopeptide repeat-containing diguanylate cyclase n=1 Tax=uncultured Alteromonas sp. TaxID=179113 RepID=UPI00260145B7|nr:diguanylate cyclase [uncultured Alteromonas sp.]